MAGASEAMNRFLCGNLATARMAAEVDRLYTVNGLKPVLQRKPKKCHRERLSASKPSSLNFLVALGFPEFL
jgi:hypothetical protein